MMTHDEKLKETFGQTVKLKENLVSEPNANSCDEYIEPISFIFVYTIL